MHAGIPIAGDSLSQSVAVADREAQQAASIAADSITLIDALLRQQRVMPSKTAFRFLADGENESGRLTYGELFQRASAVAAGLQQRGIFGQRVLLVFDSGLDFVTALWGCLLAGATAVPTVPPDPLRLRRTLPRLQAIAADALPAAALTASGHERHVVLQAMGAVSRSLEALSLDDLTAANGSHWRPPPVEDDSPAVLQYTSGSTGTPRGVLLSHRNVLSSVAAMCREDVPSAVGVSWLPPHHDFGLIGGMLLPVYAGRETVFMPSAAFVQRPLRWLAAISRYRGTTSGAPNFAYELCTRKVRAQELDGIDLSSWRVAVVGAEQVRSSVLADFAAKFAAAGFRPEAFLPAYGLAEAVLNVTSGRWFDLRVERSFSRKHLAEGRVCPVADHASDAWRLVGCGRAWSGQRVEIVDPSTLRRSPADAVGEIWVQSPNVALGYWNRPHESRTTFDARTADGDGPFLRTGDLGFFHEGELFVVGRIKELIIIRGRNYYPHDIEAAVARGHAALRPGGGAAFACEMGGAERVVIVHEVRRGPGFDPEKVMAAIRRELAAEFFLAPGAVVLIPGGALPRTNSGKIARAVCRESFLRGQLPVVAQWRAASLDQRDRSARPMPQSPLELEVARHWCEVLRVDSVALDDNFFELGGNSLSAVELYTRLRALLPPDYSLSQLFGEPTIAALCNLIRNHQAAEIDSSMADVLAEIESISEEEAQRRHAQALPPKAV